MFFPRVPLRETPQSQALWPQEARCLLSIMIKFNLDHDTVGLLPLTEVRNLALESVELRSAELFSEQSHHG
jgi:hypothetical protein